MTEEVRWFGPTVGPASVEAATAPSAAAIDHDIDAIAKTITDGLVPRFDGLLRKLGDDLYDDMRRSVEAYLTDNVTDNLRSGLTYANLYQRLYQEQRDAATAKVEALLSALKAAQHALVCCENYRATDLSVEVFEAHIANGIPRDTLEFMIDNTPALAVIDAAIAKAEGRS